MKTMEMPLKTISILIVVVIVLISLGFFITSQSGQSGTSASYDRVFFSKCEQIQQNGCGNTPAAWESANSDTDFLNACRHLFGEDQKTFSCINQFCSACQQYKTADETLCGGWCNGLQGSKSLPFGSASIQTMCGSNLKCAATCSVCHTT